MRVRFLVTPVGLMMGNIESARRLQNALSKQGVEVVTGTDSGPAEILHVHTPVPPSNFGIVRKAKKAGIRVVMHAHTTAEDAVGTWTGSELFSGVTGRYLTRFYNLGDVVLAPSAWTKTRLEARGVTSPIRVLSNGVDLDRFSFNAERRRTFREKYGIPNGAEVVYSVGVLCLKKGIETFPAVANSLPELEFVWVGHQSKLYHPFRVKRAIGRCGDNARFLFDVNDIVDAHCGGDIFFTPSFAENQGMAVMEAMSVGRPVVARDLPSYEGLLADGINSMICHQPQDFIESIKRLKSDSSLSSEIVGSARRSVSAHSIKNVAQELEAIYDSLLGGRESREGVVA